MCQLIGGFDRLVGEIKLVSLKNYLHSSIDKQFQESSIEDVKEIFVFLIRKIIEKWIRENNNG